MAYFPLFIEMKNLKILVVGGGTIAYEKLEKLTDFTKNITIITIEVMPNIQEIVQKYHLTLTQKPYQKNECLAYDIVIIATNNIEIHQQIYKESRGSRTLVNSVDNTKYCDFIFPSYLKQDDLTIAFSTSGASPAFAKKIKYYFKNKIPSNIGDFLEEMKGLREKIPKGRERMVYFEKKVEEYFKKNFK